MRSGAIVVGSLAVFMLILLLSVPTAPAAETGTCNAIFEWNNGGWMYVTGSVVYYCVDGMCTNVGGEVSGLPVYLGPEVEHTVEVNCGDSSLEKTIQFFPVEFVPTKRGVKIALNTRCHAYTVCLNGKCGKRFLQIKVPSKGSFYDALLVCDGKAVKKRVFVSWKEREGKKPSTPPERNIPELNIPLRINTPRVPEVNNLPSPRNAQLPRPKTGVPLTMTEKGLEINGLGKIIGWIRERPPKFKVKTNGHLYTVEPDENIDPPPATDFYYLEANGTVLNIHIEGPSPLRVWKFDGNEWRFLGEFNGIFELNILDNGPFDLDPEVNKIRDPIGVGTGGLTVSENLDPKFADAGSSVTVYGHVEKNGSAVVNNWINVFLDGNRLGGPTYMVGPSDWWDPRWKYRVEVNISNPDGADISGVDIAIDLNTLKLFSEGKLQRDAEDIRVVDSDGTLLPFWIEGVDTNITPIPQASDDTDPTTADAQCETNPPYRYIVVDDSDENGSGEEPDGWYSADFNDASWSISNAPFGNTGGECTTVLTNPPQDLFLRKTFQIPGEPVSGQLKIAVGGGVRCYVNGNPVLDDLTADNNATYWNYIVDLPKDVLKKGDNLLACWVAVGGENTGSNAGYFDAELNVTYNEKVASDINIWVRLDLPVSGKKIYIYYGNPEATSAEDFDGTFYLYELNKSCQGYTAGGSCSVDFNPTTDLNLYNGRFFTKAGATLDMWMGGDFGSSSEYADVYYAVDGGGNNYIGSYDDGKTSDSCELTHAVPTDPSYPPFPMEVSGWIEGHSTFTMTGDTTSQVNYSTCNDYYYKFQWYLKTYAKNLTNGVPTISVGPEMMMTTTDATGDYSWTFEAPQTPGEHIVRVEVNDGTDSAQVEDILYVRKNLRILWADVLPRLNPPTYRVLVKSLDASITEVNLVVSDSSNNDIKTLSCSSGDGVSWTCDLNVLELNKGETYILKAEGYSSGVLTGFDAKFAVPDSQKVEEFSTERDINQEENVYVSYDKITLLGVLSGFSYRRMVTITNTTTQNLEIPAKIVLDTNSLISAGKMRSDCGDVRITLEDGVTEIPYYLDGPTCNTNNTEIWVRIALHPQETKTLYLYYGNPDATSESNGYAVFDFFEDFEEWNGWVQYGSGQVSQSCGDSVSGSCSLVKTTANDPNGGYKPLGFELNRPFVLEAWVKRINFSGGSCDRIGVIDDSGNGYGPGYCHNSSNGLFIDKRSGYSATINSTNDSGADIQNEWYRMEFVWDNGSMTASYYSSDGTLQASTSYSDTSYSSFTNFYVFGGHDYLVDGVRIYYKEPAPAVSVGSEESVPSIPKPSGSWLGGFSERYKIVVNYGGEEITDYQLKIVLNTARLISEGRMRSDCGDVRFTKDDGSTILSYYLDPATCNSERTLIYVKLDKLYDGEEIYMYFNNPSATSQSDLSVFDFFEDFEEWNGWVQYGSGQVSQSCGDSVSGSCSLVKTTANDPNGGYKPLGFELNRPFVLEAWVKRINFSGGSCDRIGVIDDSGNGYGPGYCHNSSNGLFIDKRSGYSATINSTNDSGADIQNEWYRMEFVWDNGSMTASYYSSDGTLQASTSYSDTSYSSFTNFYVFGGHDYLVDGVRIRKYASPEPRIKIIAYEPLYASSGYVEFNDVTPYKLKLWQYLVAEVNTPPKTKITAELHSDGNLLCSFDLVGGLDTYDISGCARDTNYINLKLSLSTEDPHTTPVINQLKLQWIEDANILLIEPNDVYLFRNEGSRAKGWLKVDSDCTDANAYLQFMVAGAPKTIEEYNYDHFITRDSDQNVTIGEDIRLTYLHPDLGYYKIPVAVTNSGTDLYNYPVKVLIDTASLIRSGKMREDCGDIRVVDSSFNELNYWIKDGTCNTSSTELWVLLPHIPNGTTTFFIYHGNLDNTSKSNGDAVFPEENTLSGECSGSTAGGVCTTIFALPTGKAAAPYQPSGYGELSILMSGDFDYGGAIGDSSTCNTNNRERSAFYVNGTCIGVYSTGYQDCTDRAPPNTPVDVREIVVDQNEVNIVADADPQVNYDPGCGYYYHYSYNLKLKLRPKADPEPSISVGSSSPDVSPTGYYISDPLDTGLSNPVWGSISWYEQEPSGTYIKVYVRASPDATTWSDWIEVENGGEINAPSARYIQYKVEFGFNNGVDIPIFDNLKIVYYEGSSWTLAGPTTALVTLDDNPYLCGNLTAGSTCEPLWNITPKEKGEYKLRMYVESGCGFGGYSNEKVFYSFARTTTTLTADKNVVAKGDVITFSGTVTDELGNPVARRPIYIYDNGSLIGTAYTDDSGNYSFPYRVPTTESVGYHTIEAYFPRDSEEYYWESNASITVKYSSRPVISDVNVLPPKAGIGDEVLISARVTDEVGLDSVTLEVNNGVATYTLSMSGNGDTYTADFNDTWIAGAYTFTIIARNVDGIESNYGGTFSVEGYATYGVEVKEDNYGAQEDVLLHDDEYWPNPLSTYSVYVDGEGWYGSDVSAKMTLPTSYDPFERISVYEFIRNDAANYGVTFGPGVEGNAAYFNGSAYAPILTIPQLRPRDSITIGAWINMDSNVGNRYVLSLTDTSSNHIYALYSPDGTTQICFALKVSGSEYSACSPELGTGSWHHVVGTFDGATIWLYVDGNLSAYASAPGSIDYSNYSEIMTIGGRFNGSSFDSGWKGYIDELKMYPAFFPDYRVRDLYQGKKILLNPNGYWSFDDTLEDSHPYKENAVVVNSRSSTEVNFTALVSYLGVKNAVSGTPTFVGGREGNGLLFNGTPISIDQTDFGYINTFTVAAWVHPEDNGTIIEKGYPNNPSWSLEFNGGFKCHLRSSGGTEYTASSPSLSLNTWYHVACVFDRFKLRLYINGSEANSVGVTEYGSFTNTSDVNVGEFSGVVDDLRIYHYPLRAKDIANLYSGKDVRWGISYYNSFDTNDLSDQSMDWTVRVFSGGWPVSERTEATSGSSVTLSGNVLKVIKRSAICNTGETNVSGYLYVDVQVGSGSTWSTVPPVPVNDLSAGTKRTIAPGTCLSVADIYNSSPWNTDGQPSGLYRVRMALIARGGSPGDETTYVTLSDGRKVVDTDEFNIVSAKLSLSDINHYHLANFGLNEYETTDNIQWVDVYVKAEDSNALDVNVTLTLTDEYRAYAGFGPNNETKYYGTIPRGEVKVERWDNGGSGYYIPENVSPGTYQFRWLVEMNASNGPSVEDFTKYVTIHNLPADFNSTAPTRIYYYDDHNGYGTYQFCMKNPWSQPITDVKVTINCPSGVGLDCYGKNSGTATETLSSLSSGDSACLEFNIVATPSSVSGDYDINVDVEYNNPAGNHKVWSNQQNHVVEIRKAGILEIVVDSYPTDVVRGEDNALFITHAHNTGTVNDDNAWIAFKVYPAEWNVIDSNTNGTLVSDVNAFTSSLPPDANLDLNVLFDIPPDANLGPQLVRIETGTSTDANWGDFKNLYVTVWDRPRLLLEANDYNASVGEKIQITARLLYSDGTPIPNQRINFEKNDSPLGSTETNTEGYAIYIWDLSSESPGTYEINAIFEGNNSIYVLPEHNTITINVGLPPEVNAWLDTYDTGYGMDVTIYADANDDQGINRVWAEINDPEGNVTEINLSPSGSNYSSTFQPWKEGNYTIVVYAEDLYGSVSSSDPLTLHVSASALTNLQTDKNFYLQGELVKLVSPDWWNDDWMYRRKITVTNNSGSTLSGYVLRIPLNTYQLIEENKARKDLGDVRFIKDGSELNYWFEAVPIDEFVVPRSSNDTDPATVDGDCSVNPQFKYYYCYDVCLPTGWYEPNYDDSTWSTGNGPFGNTGGECTTVLNNPPDDLFVRKWFEVNGPVNLATLYVAVGGGVRCYVNGNLVLDQISSVTSASYWNYTVDITPYVQYGNNLLACWVANGGENSGGATGYLDVAVEVNYTPYKLTEANFWVKMDIPPGETNIFVYYGNPSAIHDNNVDVVSSPVDLNAECAGYSTSASCSSELIPSGYKAFTYQDGVTLNFLTGGDYSASLEYIDVYYSVDGGGNNYIGAYDNGDSDDCTLVQAQPQDASSPSLPLDFTSVVKGVTSLLMTADSTDQVNYSPCGDYFFKVVWELNHVRLVPYVSPEPEVNVGPETSFTGSFIYPFKTFKSYLIGLIERNENGSWVYVDTDFNDLATSTLRTFTEGVLFDTSSIWNDWNTYGKPQGEYRARIVVVGPDGSPLTYNGQPIEEWNTFTIGPPPVDVSITDFRVYDITGATDPRTEGNLIDSGLEKTIYLSADRNYRFEVEITVNSSSNDWNVADSNILYKDLNSSWSALDIWYTLPDGSDMNGGVFDGNVEWNTQNDGTVGAGLKAVFKVILDLNTLYAEERNTTIVVTHPAFIERSDWVVIKTYVPDTIPPSPTDYNLINLDTNQVGPEINVIRSFERARIYAYWNEDIGDAYVEYNSTSTSLTTDTITPEDNYTEYNFNITSFWYLGRHMAKIHAADLSGNWNDDLNYLIINVWGIADIYSIEVNDTNLYQGDTVEANCTVVDRTDTNAPIPNYPVKFYDNGSPIGTAYTDSNGVASISYTFLSFGDHTLSCVVEENDDLWYKVDPPGNEKNITLFVKESVPPEWNEVNYNDKVHRGDTLETNVHWTDNHKVSAAKLYITRFKYRRPVTIENNEGTDLNDFQVKVVVDTASLISAGKMRSDCGDVRFYDGSMKLPYYLELNTCNTSSTIFWVKTDVPASGKVIYIYYGNPDATSESNGYAVFDFFEDFEEWNGWVQYGNGQVSQDCTTSLQGSCSLHKTTASDPNGGYKALPSTLGRGIVLEAWINRNPSYAGGSCDRIGLIDDSGDGYGFGYCHDSSTGLFIDVRSNYSGTTQASNDSGADVKGEWYLSRLIVKSDGNLIAQYEYGGSLQASTSYSDTSYSSFTRVYVFGGYDYWVDVMRVRKYGDVSATLGSEEWGAGGPATEVGSAAYDTNDVWAALNWNVPSDEPLGVHYWYQEANDPSNNISDTNLFEFNVWGWSGIVDSTVDPATIPPDNNTTLYCLVEDVNLNAPIAGYHVDFYWDGNYVGSSDTNTDGWASLEYNVGSQTGVHTFECRISSDPVKLYDPYPGLESRSEYVNVTTSSDTVPPSAVEWNVIDVNIGVEGKEINIYRGDELNFWSVWDENLSSAWVETTISGTSTTTFSATVDGNRAVSIIDTNSQWSRGLHTLLMKAQDEANNVSLDENSAEVNVYVWVRADVEWVSPKETVNKNSDMNAVCRVYEEDTNSGIESYTVAFYSSLNGGTYLGSAETNSEGYATLFVDLNDYYGTYDFWCQIGDDPARYYEANVDTDKETITVAAINLVAKSLDINEPQPAKEGSLLEVNGTVWNQYDPVDANVEIKIERREGDGWILWSDYVASHSFEANEENHFTYLWTTYPGTYRITLAVDPENKVSEDNETDNVITTEYNVHSWSELYGEVNAEKLLASSTGVFYNWAGGGNGVVIFFDSDFNSIDPDLITPMDANDMVKADDVLDMNGSWDSIYNVYTGGDGNIDNYHTFLINGNPVTLPAVYEDNWPVGIGYVGSSTFDGTQPIVFVTEINWDAPCPYGTCDYYAKVPALLRRQVTTTESVKSDVVPS